MGEVRHGERIGKKPDAAAVAHAGERKPVRQRRARLVIPDHRQREEPARCAALGVRLDLAKQNLALAAEKAREIEHVRGFDRLVLGGEPAPLGEVKRQRLAFERRGRGA